MKFDDTKRIFENWKHNIENRLDEVFTVEEGHIPVAKDPKTKGKKILNDEDKKKKLIHLICRIKGEKVYDDVTEVGDVKINIDENPNIPSKYGVQSIPTLIILKKGEIVATKVGSSLKSDILSWIESVI